MISCIYRSLIIWALNARCCQSSFLSRRSESPSDVGQLELAPCARSWPEVCKRSWTNANDSTAPSLALEPPAALVTLEDGPKSANEARRLLQTRLDECECEPLDSSVGCIFVVAIRVKMYDEGPIRTCSAVGLKSVSFLKQLGLQADRYAEQQLPACSRTNFS